MPEQQNPEARSDGSQADETGENGDQTEKTEESGRSVDSEEAASGTNAETNGQPQDAAGDIPLQTADSTDTAGEASGVGEDPETDEENSADPDGLVWLDAEEAEYLLSDLLAETTGNIWYRAFRIQGSSEEIGTSRTVTVLLRDLEIPRRPFPCMPSGTLWCLYPLRWVLDRVR